MNQFGLFKCRRHAGERQSNAGREAKPTLTQQVNEFKSHLWKNFICICYQIPFVSANRLHLYLQWMIVHPGPVSQYTAEKKDHSGLNLSRARRYLLLLLVTWALTILESALWDTIDWNRRRKRGLHKHVPQFWDSSKPWKQVSGLPLKVFHCSYWLTLSMSFYVSAKICWWQGCPSNNLLH